MFRWTIGLMGVVMVGLASTPASAADDWFYFGRRPSYYYRHERVHDELDHNDFHRELIHRDAHRYPMTWRSHERLHDGLAHDAYHDDVAHSRWHRGNDYGYSRGVYFGGGSTRIHVRW